ncbi:MAG: nucleotide exchange factor GrpE [Candidatus Ranarchaeia archaeon]|jgi:molecular chaperone GrpE
MAKESEKQNKDTRDKFKTSEKKSSKKTKSIDPCQEELKSLKYYVTELEDQQKYLQADMDNLRKYYAKQWKEKVDYANEDLLKGLLTTLDDLERAVTKIKDPTSKHGVELILKEFKKILERYGVSPIKAIGKKFDPKLHEAMSKVQSDTEEDTILEEYQRGYLLKKKVIRFSKVKISGGPENG